MRLLVYVTFIVFMGAGFLICSFFLIAMKSYTNLTKFHRRPETATKWTILSDTHTIYRKASKSNQSTATVNDQAVLKSATGGKSVARTLARRLPKCLIIGFAKCGTYALMSFLTLHPDIVSPNREISYFTKNYHKGLDWYRSQMPLSLQDQVTIEKTPNYILSSEALLRISLFNSSIKLIISVRDPITRLQSAYSHAVASGRILGEDFQSWLRNEDTFTSVVNYEKYARRVYQIFPSDQILLITEEQLQYKPLSVMRQVENFLGLRKAFTSDLLVFQSEKGFYCFNKSSSRYHAVAATLNIDHRTGCLSASKGRRHPQIQPRLLKEIVFKVKPYNEKLFALAGKRLNWTDLDDADKEIELGWISMT